MAEVVKPVFTVSVRELIEFVLRRGDLGGQRAFAGRARALAGTRGHQQIQRSRPEGYEKEVPLVHELDAGEFILRIQGRIDGVLAAPRPVLLEEIKTTQGPWKREADPLHWAQAKCYGFIYAQDHGLDQILLQLTYLDLETSRRTEFRQLCSLLELTGFFQETTAQYLEWVRECYRWRQARDQSIRALGFPFPCYREGQRELAVAVYRTLARGGRLFLEAPTGIGKTMSVLFPGLKALAEDKLEQIFYLTARTMGRAAAEQALAELRQAGLRLRSLTLTAQEKICFQEGGRCDPQTCPFALGYYDRCKAAMRDALRREGINRPVLEAIGREHQVCPFELSLDLSPWVDAIICDYNYVFDPKIYLRRLFPEEDQPCGFLVDEAHNLVDRAREMFSAELESREINQVRRSIKGSLPRCARALSKLGSALRHLGRSAGLTTAPDEAPEMPEEQDLFAADTAVRETNSFTRKEGAPPTPGRDERVLVLRELPESLGPLLETALKHAEDWLGQNRPAEFRESLLELYFRLHAFFRTAELYDERFVTIVEPGAGVRVRLFCLDPSFLLGEALKRGKAAVFFSATLTPLDYYRTLLGGRPEDAVLQLASPFPAANLAVLVQDRIRTQLKARAGSLADVVQAIGALVSGRPGNYLVYLPSYQYLESVQAQFQSLHPAITVLGQRAGMSESERESFLAEFSHEHGKTLVGFAVMGGIFGESIDLVGERLIGVVSVGVGLPQLCTERDLIRDYFDARNGAGFDYAYTFPGMNRVLQAAGRVIRSETDRGLVLLIDTRFAQARYRGLFPRWWQPRLVSGVAALREAVAGFWQRTG